MMSRMFRQVVWVAVLVASVGLGASVQAMQPITTDSRIKVLVYNEYDVYPVLTTYGYQSNIEFSEREEVVTISIGDRVAWQVVPAGRRIFIRALEENARTNMTVITNKRTYQFDLMSRAAKKVSPSEELIYVMRFYYPDEDTSFAHASAPAVLPPLQVAPAVQPLPAPVAPMTAPAAGAINYNYSYTGNDGLAPLKVFDNGRATFFRLRKGAKGQVGKIFVISEQGTPLPISQVPVKNGFVMVGTVAREYIIRYGTGEIRVYKEG